MKKFSSIKLDYKYLVSTGYFIKLPVIIFVLFALLIGYNKWVPTETPQKVLNTQFMMMDDLKALLAKDYSITTDVREEAEMQIAQIYQNLSEENFSYKKSVTSKKLLSIYKERIKLLNTLKILLPNYSDKLPDISKLEDEKLILEYLSDSNQDYMHYKTTYVVIKIILYFSAFGGFLFLYIFMVANFHKRKLSHKSLVKALPISIIRLNIDEWFYTLGLFYFLPVIIVLIGISLYCIAFGVNFFNYPFLIATLEGTRIYSAYHLLFISIFYPVVSTYICYIFEKILVFLFKDEILSIICLLTLIVTCIIFGLFNTPFGMMIVLPIIHNNQSLTIGFLLLSTCMLFTFYVTNYLFIKFLNIR
ncbi:hypothetical protein [uncultured Granulicatella sp.]|uniref:hypothetical protein n=1 Tax=uncultured Granulicatella sp. TaxID=316089 RepID=UPI0028D139CD|nr:hypothetical protein [uncultured Granulicatella sp.]